MKLKSIKLILLFSVTFVTNFWSQETLPIYTDYLSDNVYLVHPSAAGIGNSSKLRFTARQQWLGIPDAPALQTVSFHTRLGEYSNTGLGVIIFNDKNGFHSQKGFQGTYTYHLPLSFGQYFNQLSFGLSASFVQNEVDQRTFLGDPQVAAIIESSFYYNADFSMGYHLGGFSSYFTIKNLLLTAKNNLNLLEPLNLRNYILSAGYYFGEEQPFQFEPSVMIQLRESTGERLADINMKVYRKMPALNASLWAVLSYRRNFDADAVENAQYFTPVVGVNYNKWMFSYSYTKQLNDIVLTTGGLHQISVGYDLFVRKPRAAACPNINSAFGSF